ncbi:putative membrane protein [Shigella dysenteriae 1617]|nr:putative membrane protein [Shigella dysenteriae 1617]
MAAVFVVMYDKKIIPAVVCLLLCSCTTFPQAVAPVNGDASN